jgi:hypothetical protein
MSYSSLFWYLLYSFKTKEACLQIFYHILYRFVSVINSGKKSEHIFADNEAENEGVHAFL